jgi:hypothetical protein
LACAHGSAAFFWFRRLEDCAMRALLSTPGQRNLLI